MSAHREEHLELCAALALGAIDERDRRELEAHLAAGCPECSRELARLSDDVRGSGGLRASDGADRRRCAPACSRRCGPERRRSAPARGRVVALEPRRRIAFATWAWAAAAAVLAVSTVVMWRIGEDLRARLDESRGQMAKLQTDLDEARRWAALLDSPEARRGGAAADAGGGDAAAGAGPLRSEGTRARCWCSTRSPRRPGRTTSCGRSAAPAGRASA